LPLAPGQNGREQPTRRLDPDHADGDAIASILMRYRDQNGQDWADIIDVLTRIPMLGDGSCGCLGRSTRPRPASYRLTASERRV
jgi:hypothetical protein